MGSENKKLLEIFGCDVPFLTHVFYYLRYKLTYLWIRKTFTFYAQILSNFQEIWANLEKGHAKKKGHALSIYFIFTHHLE